MFDEEQDDFVCPHCGCDQDPWWSRTEPMGYYCSNPECGKDVDKSPEYYAEAR